MCGYGRERSTCSGVLIKMEVSKEPLLQYKKPANIIESTVRHAVQHSSISRKHMIIEVSPVKPDDCVRASRSYWASSPLT